MIASDIETLASLVRFEIYVQQAVAALHLDILHEVVGSIDFNGRTVGLGIDHIDSSRCPDAIERRYVHLLGEVVFTGNNRLL